MLDHLEVLLALRQRLLSLRFANTGVTTLGATETAFTRPAGSFIDDGFTAGMEVVPIGFAVDMPRIVQSVTALELRIADTVAYPLSIEPESAGRSLHVGVPTIQSWENKELVPLDGRWYIDEDYIPGPVIKVNVTAQNELEYTPTYVVTLSGLSGIGSTAIYKVAGGILEGFAPGLALLLSSGSIRVRGNPGPFRGQVLSREAGRADVTITIPLWTRTSTPGGA